MGETKDSQNGSMARKEGTMLGKRSMGRTFCLLVCKPFLDQVYGSKYKQVKGAADKVHKALTGK